MLARRFFDRIEPVHAVTYFAPEARAALDGMSAQMGAAGIDIGGMEESPMEEALEDDELEQEQIVKQKRG